MKKMYIGMALLMALAGCKQPAPAAPEAAAEPAVAEQPAAVVSSEFPAVLQASGTEPFWGVRVEDGKLSYTTPETMDAPHLLEGKRELVDGALTVQGGEGDAAFKITIKHGECSDGMSDLSHPFSAEFVLGKDTFKGCARDPSVAVEAP